MREVFDFLRKSGCFYVATCEGDQPRVRPFGVTEIYEDKIYFLSGKKKKVSKQLEINPKVEICAAIGEEWMRIEGKMILDDRREVKKFFLDKNPQLRSMYSEEDDNTAMYYLEDATATISSFVKDAKVIRL